MEKEKQMTIQRNTIKKNKKMYSLICWQIRISFPYVMIFTLVKIYFILFLFIWPVTHSISPFSAQAYTCVFAYV